MSVIREQEVSCSDFESMLIYSGSVMPGFLSVPKWNLRGLELLTHLPRAQKWEHIEVRLHSYISLQVLSFLL